MTNLPPPPPTLDSYRNGTKLRAGLGETTIIADLDFETYSPAGYHRGADGRLHPPRGSSDSGLFAVGAACYSEHPDAEVICMAYDLKDGSGRQLWVPSMDWRPTDLFEYLAAGGLLEAWNVSFEHWIWMNICVPKYGFPPLPIKQLRCAAAKARAHALPGGLEKTGEVLDIQNKKDKDGKRLIGKFSIPRHFTKDDKRERIQPHEDQSDALSFYNYCLRDIQAEAELSSLIPDLTPDELEFWQCDQAINRRGIQIDLEHANAAINIIEQAYAKYNARLRELTNGEVSAASEVARLIKWLGTQGVMVTELGAKTLDDLLSQKHSETVQEVLKIRHGLSSAAVKKLYSMVNRANRTGRVNDLFIYHSARTGRAAGEALQPQNLPKSGPDVWRGGCGKYYSKGGECPWCGFDELVSASWNHDAVLSALETIRPGDLNCLEYYWDEPLEVIAGCLRSLIIAAPGHDLICSDYSAIEAVVLAALAGEEWRMEVFRTHGQIYEMSAAKISGIPFEEFERHRKETGSHHPARGKIGKVAELACFAPDTQVLTNRGYVAIVDILLTDKLWDGVEWVSHGGVILKGKRLVLSVDGVRMTPEHPISFNDSWTEARLLVSNKSTLLQALANGSANLPSLKTKIKKPLRETASLLVVALAGNLLTPPTRILGRVVLSVATFARRKLQLRQILNGLNITGKTPTLSPALSTVDASRGDSLRRSVAAITPITPASPTMARAGYTCAMSGGKIAERSFSTLQPFRVGMMNSWRWIESTAIGVMSRVISVLFQGRGTNSTKEKLTPSSSESETLSTVYDIVNAGPRSRFTIKTKTGHLIVHNSGYGGWLGAWKQFGADRFMSDEEIQQAARAWRQASPNIVKMWGGQGRYGSPPYGLEGAAISSVASPGKWFEYRGVGFITQQNVLYCRLLSGRFITYHKPLLQPGDRSPISLSFEGWNTNPKNGPIHKWIRMRTYGGKLTENVVQATARDILAHAVVNLERAGYPVVLHVHDEIVAEVPKGFGSVEEFEGIMSTLPTWACDWPVRARGGWRGDRYRKEG